jgi:hypothetical protein
MGMTIGDKDCGGGVVAAIDDRGMQDAEVSNLGYSDNEQYHSAIYQRELI